MQKTTIRYLPSLNALRAFESSARHLSFTKAAKELFVTQGAVSRQIKQLEEQIQMPLFHRCHRQLILTDQGRMLLAPLTEAFDLMATALERLKNQPRDLRLKVHPTFAIRWLIPRLHRFQKNHPKIQIRLTTSSINVDFSRENFDVGIVYIKAPNEEKKSAGMVRTKIATERLTPVCSPSYMSKEKRLESAKDLKHHRLLHNNPEHKEWRIWAEWVGVMELSFERGQTFEMDDAALQAAASGLGIALGNINLIKDDLETNRLVQPLEGQKNVIAETGVYYLACPVGPPSSELVTFKKWLVSELERESGRIG